MRVLLVGENHRAEIRGRTIAIQGLARALRDRGHDVTLVQAASPEHRVEIDGVRMRYTAVTRKSLYPLVLGMLDTGGYDVVHTNDEAGAYLALRSRLGRMPLVAHFHPPHVRVASYWKSNWRWRYIRLAARSARRLITPSAWLADALAEGLALDRARIQVIPYGVREDWFKAARPPDSSGGGVLRVVLVNMKGVDVALRAFAMAGAGLECGAQLELIGLERDRHTHRALARELGIESQVRFRGFIEHGDLPAAVAGADLLLHPSRGESFGQVLAEAAALGVPAITSDATAMPEVVRDGETGLLCPVDDVAAFAAALSRLLSDDPLRAKLGDAARCRAESLWHWERSAARIEEEVYAPLGA